MPASSPFGLTVPAVPVFAVAPLACGAQEQAVGADTKGPLAVIGGRVSSTLPTPVAYSPVENGVLRLRGHSATRHPASA